MSQARPARSEPFATFVLSRARQRLAGAAEAEDLAQETLARLAAHPPPPGREQPWAERVLGNLVVDGHRRRRVRQAALVVAPEPGAPMTPEEATLRAEAAHHVRTALAELPTPLRRSVELCFWDGLSHPESARAMAVEPATARTRVHRALAELRKRLGGLRALLPGWMGLQPLVGVSSALVLVVHVSSSPPVASGAAPVAPSVVVAQAARRPEPARAPVAPSPAPARATPARKAQPAPPAQVAPRRLDFDDDEVEGSVGAPDGVWIPGDPRAAPSPSMLEIPGSFVGQLVRSLDEV